MSYYITKILIFDDMESIEITQDDIQLAALSKIIMSLKPTNGKHIYKINVETLEISRLIGNDYKSYVASLSERKEDIVPKLNHLYCAAKSPEKAAIQFGKILQSLSEQYENID
jgi:hypothetical protein